MSKKDVKKANTEVEVNLTAEEKEELKGNEGGIRQVLINKAILDTAKKYEFTPEEKEEFDYHFKNEKAKFFIAKEIESKISVNEDDVTKIYNETKDQFDAQNIGFTDAREIIQRDLLQQQLVTLEDQEINKLIQEMKDPVEVSKEEILFSKGNPDVIKAIVIGKIIERKMKDTDFEKKEEENIKIKVSNVNYYYEKERNVIDNLSVNIPKDSITAITGKSGAGKTTLIEIMSGLIFLGENFSGEIEYKFRSENTENEKLLLYKNISEKDLSEIRKRMGIVFQNTGEQFFSGTVQEELEYNIMKKCKIKNRKSKELSNRINEIAELFGYDEKFLMKSPFVLSGGEKKMLGLALAVCLEPEILLLDEPTGALDYNMTIKFMKIIEKMKKDGTTILLVTHDENIVKQYSDYILKL